MDLDRCPKCGQAWGGGDMCRHCRFVPIGAGLQNLPKKKKKKVRKYVEPGSARGFLTLTLLVAVGYGCFRYRPWEDDWELVRSIMGQGKHHSLVGEWEVTKTVAVKGDDAWIAKEGIDKGTMKFSDKGMVKIDLFHPSSETVANGTYLQEGVTVAMRNVQTTGDSSTAVPPVIKMNLAWTGNDTVVAMDKSQAIYLHRRKKSGSLLTFMQMGLRKDAKPDDGKAPDEIRGMIGTMKRQAEEADASGDSSDSKDN